MPAPLRLLAAILLPLSLVLSLAGCGRDEPLPGTPRGGDFVLQSADGPVDSKALRGSVLLVYFGYTHCPDVCPASLSNLAKAMNALTAEERRRVRPLMISVDPERDTPAQLKEYANYFHPAMIGATGSPAAIAAVAKAFGAGYQRQPEQPGGSYAVDHSADVHVVAPDGRLAAIVRYSDGPDRIVAAVRKLL